MRRKDSKVNIPILTYESVEACERLVIKAIAKNQGRKGLTLVEIKKVFRKGF